MAASTANWERVMEAAEKHARGGEIERATALIAVAAEMRAMLHGARHLEAFEKNGGIRVAMQATTQNTHTVARTGDPKTMEAGA